MSRLFRYLVITTALAVATFTFHRAAATQFVGGDFAYTFIDSAAGIYHYRVSLIVYEDSLNAPPNSVDPYNPAYIGVYDGAGQLIEMDTNVYYSSDVSTPLTAGSGCASTSILMIVNQKTFTQDLYLPASATGYNIVYQHCCNNPELVNVADPGNTGFTAMCNIPPIGVTTHNNSAVFTNFPAFILQLNTPITYDCSATDADDDSLSYEFCPAYIGGDQSNIQPFPAPPPFATFVYLAPFSYSNPVSSAAPLAIDPVTGQITGTPDEPGHYLVSVCVNEWRSGVNINKVQRVFQLWVTGCDLFAPSLSVGNQVELYPNPASTELTISSQNQISQITLTNLLGQTLLTHDYNTEQVQVDVADLPSGVYFVKINGSEVRKFVKE